MASVASLILPFLALLVALGVTAVLALVVPASLYLATGGSLSATDRTLYVTFIAVLATILTAFLASQVQALLLHTVDRELQRCDPLLPIDELDARCRVVLRLGGLRERAKNAEVVAMYLMAGLVTTAIVAGLSPSVGTKVSWYRPRVPNGPSRVSTGVMFGDTPGLCAMVDPLEKTKADGRDYSWDLGNGSAYFLPANMPGCPTRLAVTLAGSINAINPDAFAYVDGGVAVHRSAIGAPFTIYSSDGNAAPDLSALLNAYGPSVTTTTQCVPIMKQNPIACHSGGTLTLQSSWFNVTSTDNLCTVSKHLPQRDPASHSTLVKTMCAHDLVGQGTIVMAASGAYARWLAMTINDIDHIPPLSPSSTYAVSCTVDTRSVWEYRTVKLGFQGAAGSRYARSLESSAVCQPVDYVLDEALYATAAAANWQLLIQNEDTDGWFDSIDQVTGDGRGPPYAFTSSTNALEDILGLTAALVSSRLNSSSQAQVNGTAIISATRVGTGKGPAIIYAFPPVAVAAVLLYLILVTRKLERPRYSVTRVGSLIDFGKTMGMDTAGPGNPPARRVTTARAGYVFLPHF